MNAPQVESYSFGQMTVDGERHSKDLILLPDRVLPHWWRNQGHRLSVEDLEAIFEAAPDVLVVGTGAYGRMAVPAKTRKAVEDAGIELRADETGEAWQLYNELQQERRTAGAFHLTC
jgi:hypothetical protein